MIFLDTWIWMEFLGKTEETEKAKNIIESSGRKALSTAALAELHYHATKKFSPENAESIIHIIESNRDVAIIPLSAEIAKYASDLRLKYYDKKTKDLSFIDCINLATAIKIGCDTFYTGDPDFDGIEEIKIVNIRMPPEKGKHYRRRRFSAKRFRSPKNPKR